MDADSFMYETETDFIKIWKVKIWWMNLIWVIIQKIIYM